MCETCLLLMYPEYFFTFLTQLLPGQATNSMQPLYCWC